VHDTFPTPTKGETPRHGRGDRRRRPRADEAPEVVIAGRHRGDELVMVGRTVPLTDAQSAELAPLLRPARRGHPWPDEVSSQRWGGRDSRKLLSKVDPTVVLEVTAGAFYRSSRRPTRGSSCGAVRRQIVVAPQVKGGLWHRKPGPWYRCRALISHLAARSGRTCCGGSASPRAGALYGTALVGTRACIKPQGSSSKSARVLVAARWSENMCRPDLKMSALYDCGWSTCASEASGRGHYWTAVAATSQGARSSFM
jgi:hypothetical protein